MAKAGQAMIRAEKQLSKAGYNLVGRVTGGIDVAQPWAHYPADDVYDYESASQYYYHTHDDRGDDWPSEHGHFHLFLRDQALPYGKRPVRDGQMEGAAIAHLVAISMDRMGRPLELFATNGWVTSEDFYLADDLVAALPRFSVDHTAPCLALNQWLTAATRFFAPHITRLIRTRDEILTPLVEEDCWECVLEDRKIEVIARISVTPEAQMREILDLLGASSPS